MRVFICWHDDRSRAVAMALHGWLPKVIQKIEPWLSTRDIGSGARWRDEVARELERCDFGILRLTPENLTSEWIHFEAGAIARVLERGKVVPYLLEVEKSALRDPLAQFQSVKATRDDTLELVKALNGVLADGQLPDDILRESFDLWWGKLEASLTSVPKILDTQPHVKRQTEEILEELLERVRAMEAAIARLTKQPEDNLVATAIIPIVPGGARPKVELVQGSQSPLPEENK